MTRDLPSGTVTFLFTDIEGSTPLWECEPERMRPALERHNGILRQAVAAHNGALFKTIGDAIQAAFALPADGLAAALAAQRELEAAQWPTSTPLRVRMGLHTGPAELAGSDYAVAHTLNRAARIMAAAHGGQIVLSAEVAELLHGDLPPDSSLRDLGHHRMKGMTQREHLFQLAAPGLPSGFPPLATLDAIPNNLPVQLTSFVGREQEISHLLQLIDPALAAPERGRVDEVRLLTLTGPGGTGKTRLGLQVAARVLEAFPDGVWLVELAPLADPALVAQSVASTLGVREQPERALLEVLADHLRAKRLLLILDNCEHLIGACAEAANRLLRAAPGVKILASSREALGVAGETTWPVLALALPDPQTLLAPETLGKIESIHLFIDRALATRSQFELVAQNAPAVVKICRRLGGIPLAIELAAARVKMMSVDEIARRLDDRFDLLTAGSRTALPRQQTLRATIDWSYELLSEPEQILFRRLSVFAGGFSLAAAEAVAAGGRIVTSQVIDLLGQLINKSLVNVDARGTDGTLDTRYGMLETILEYARQKNEAAGETDDSRERHLEYFSALVQRAEDGIYSFEQAAWFRRLDQEIDNLRGAMSWRIAAAEENVAKRRSIQKHQLLIVGSLPMYWERGYQREITETLATMLVDDGSSEPSRERAKALCTGGFVLWSSNKLAQARVYLEESVQIADEIGDPLTLAFALSFLGWTFDFLEDHVAAQAALERSAAIGPALGNQGKHAAGMSLSLLGDIPYRQGNLPAARRLYEDAIAFIREIHNDNFLTYPLRRLAYIALQEGKLEQAAEMLSESLELNRKLDHLQGMCACLVGFAHLRLAQGHLEQAAVLCGRVESQLQHTGMPLYIVDSTNFERCTAKVKAALEPGALSVAWTRGRALTMDEAVAYALQEG